jgi:hypothetical protein
LHEKAQQIKNITEGHGKTKTELEFYRNRSKELEGVLARAEKNSKDQLGSLEKELKASKDSLGLLDKKCTELNLIKQEV